MNIVLFINALSNSGGTERVSTLLANRLAEHHNVFFISRLRSVPFFELDNKITYLYLGKENENIFLNYLKYIIKVTWILRKYKIDKWIDVSTSMSLITVPCKLLYKFELFSWEHFNLTWEWNWLTAKISRYLACHYAQNVVVLTKTDECRFKEKFKTDNIVCIPNPVTIRPVIKSEENKIVLSIGRYTYQKGQDMMLQIWEKARCRHLGWHLKIVGGGELENELKEMVLSMKLEDSVELSPVTNNVEALYGEASIFILTSRFEGLPLALIEAVSAGLPVISFDCETGPRDVIENGYNGYLIDCFNLNDFAEKLDDVCNNSEKRQMFSNNSIDKSKVFSESKFILCWNSLLE